MNRSGGEDAAHRLMRERALFDEFTRARSMPGEELTAARIRDELIVMHTGLVRYAARTHPTEDLVQAGMVGLIRAVDTFDPDRGNAFSSFAVPHIRWAMHEHRESDGWQIHVPRRLRQLHDQVRATRARLRSEGQHPTVQQLAEALDVRVEDVLEAMALDDVRLPDSLDEPIADGSQATLGDVIGTVDPDLDRVENLQTMRALLDVLSEDERTAVVGKFVEQRSQGEIAEAMGVPPSRVSRLITRALAKMRAQGAD